VRLASEVNTPNPVRMWAYVNVATIAPVTPINIPRWHTSVTRDILATIPEGHGIPNFSLPSNSWSLGYVPEVLKGTSHRFSVDTCMSLQETITITLISMNLSCTYSFFNISVQ